MSNQTQSQWDFGELFCQRVFNQAVRASNRVAAWRA